MRFHEALEHVQDSDVYKQFMKDSEGYYLAHGFCTVEKSGRAPWQVGYYSQDTSRIVTFTADDTVSKHDEDEAFRESGHVPPLEADEVEVSLDDALATAEKVRQDKYPKELVNKTIVILQTLEDVPTWNLTLVTQAFSLINVRIDASSGEVRSQTIDSILNLGERT